MAEREQTYGVYFFPAAAEALGDAIKPYLKDGANGPHVVCSRVDTSGPLFQMFVPGANAAGEMVEFEIMVPHNMIRLVMSERDDTDIGFT
jgi:hypothetical protein